MAPISPPVAPLKPGKAPASARILSAQMEDLCIRASADKFAGPFWGAIVTTLAVLWVAPVTGQPSWAAGVWYACMLAWGVGMHVLIRRSSGLAQNAANRVQRRFMVAYLVNGAIWAGALWLLWIPGSAENHVLVMGVALGLVATLCYQQSPSFLVYLCAACPPITALIALLMAEPDPAMQVLALFALLFLAWISLVSYRACHQLREAVALRFKNQDLAEHARETYEEAKQRADELERLTHRYELISDGSTEHFWFKDIETGAFSFCSKRIAEVFYTFGGDGEGPWLLDSILPIVHPDDRTVFTGAHAKMEREEVTIEFRARGRSGAWRWFKLHGRPETEPGGRRVVVGTSTDIDDYKRSEMRVNERNVFLTDLLDAALDGIIRMRPVEDADGRTVDFLFTEVNRAACEITGRTEEELIGRTLTDNFPETRRNGLLDTYLEVYRSGAKRDFEVSYEGDGMNDWFKVAAVPSPDNLVITFERVTEAKQHEQALIAERDRAEALAKARDQFLANMSHEIRTPLNGVLGMLRLVKAESDAERRVEMLHDAESSASFLLAIISDILDLSKLDSGHVSLNPEAVDLQRLTARVAETLRPKALEKAVAFTVDYAGEVPRCVTLDETRMQQILYNIVGNALKFTERGGVRVILSYDPEAEDLCIAVHDTGPGIPGPNPERVFERFYQVDASDKRSFGGTGLGLAISKQIAELMGGSIHLKTEAGRGTSFFVSVKAPAAQVAREPAHTDDPLADLLAALPETAAEPPLPAKAEEAEEAEEPAAPQSPAAPDPAMPAAASEQQPENEPEPLGLGLNILVAEDNAINQKIIRLMLAGLGYANLRMVDDGQAALEAWRAHGADLILMDIQMPVMDGMAALAAIREEGGACPVLAITANAMAGDRERYRAAGFDGYVSKPIEPAALAEAIDAALGPQVVKSAASG